MEQEPKDAAFDGFAVVAKALAHPKRLEILDLLAQGERPVELLAEAAGLQLTTASAMLQVLHRAGLVQRRRDGTRVLYCLAGDDVAALTLMLRTVAERRVAGVELARRQLMPDDSPMIDIDPEELLARSRTGDLIVLDVRPEGEFSAGHIPGARSIPVAQLAARLAEIPEGVAVVAYCRGRYCVMSHDAVALLRHEGRDASVLIDGMLEWRAAGAPVERHAA